MTTKTKADRENLGWFWELFKNVLQSYARNTNLEFFQRKYPGLPAEVIASRRIKSAAMRNLFAEYLVGLVT